MDRSVWPVVAGLVLTLGGLVAVGVAGWRSWRRRRAERIQRRGRFAVGIQRDLGNCEKGLSEVDDRTPER